MRSLILLLHIHTNNFIGGIFSCILLLLHMNVFIIYQNITNLNHFSLKYENKHKITSTICSCLRGPSTSLGVLPKMPAVAAQKFRVCCPKGAPMPDDD